MEPKNDRRNKLFAKQFRVDHISFYRMELFKRKWNVFGFQKVDSDYSVRKRIAFLQHGQVNIYINNDVHSLSKFIVITNIEELLKIVDKLNTIRIQYLSKSSLSIQW